MAVLGTAWLGEQVWIQILLLAFPKGIGVWEQLDQWEEDSVAEHGMLADVYSLVGQGMRTSWTVDLADAIRKALLYSSGDVRDSGCTSQTKATLPMPGSVHCTKSALLHQLTKGVHGHVASVPARVDFRRDFMTSSLL